MRDALCALEWVRENIGHFGGDPARVAAFGESAGGGLLLHAIASPQARGLLAGTIVQSGATFATFDDERAALVADTMCKEAAVPDVDALRFLPVDALLDAQTRTLSTLMQPVGMMPFHPMVDGDVLPTRPIDALGAGAAAGIPLLVGTTADEMALFVDRSPLPRDRLVRRIARYLRVDEPQAAPVADAYADQLGTDDNAEIWRTFFGDREMQDPCRAVLDAHAPHGPAYTYCFTWEGPGIGACHGIDIPFPFGNFVEGWDTFVGLDDDGRALSRTMRDAWAAFARTGDPGWPRYPTRDDPRPRAARRPHASSVWAVSGAVAAPHKNPVWAGVSCAAARDFVQPTVLWVEHRKTNAGSSSMNSPPQCRGENTTGRASCVRAAAFFDRVVGLGSSRRVRRFLKSRHADEQRQHDDRTNAVRTQRGGLQFGSSDRSRRAVLREGRRDADRGEMSCSHHWDGKDRSESGVRRTFRRRNGGCHQVRGIRSPPASD